MHVSGVAFTLDFGHQSATRLGFLRLRRTDYGSQ
jgi:hypothetical protein